VDLTDDIIIDTTTFGNNIGRPVGLHNNINLTGGRRKNKQTKINILISNKYININYNGNIHTKK
jgi:hypothetical protein